MRLDDMESLRINIGIVCYLMIEYLGGLTLEENRE